MEALVIFTSVILTFLVAVILVVFLNFKDREKKISELDYRNIILQLVIITVWIGLLGNIFIPDPFENQYSRIVLFIFSVVVGIFLIRSIFSRVKGQKTIDSLINKLGANNRKLRALDQQKNEFLSIASHQLRGPVSIIRGYVSMILEEDYAKVPDSLKEPLNRIAQSSNSLSYLINDFLNVSKIEKGELEYVFENVDIVNILNNTYKNFLITAKNHNLALRKKYDENKKIKIWIDPEKITQIISNLIDNSIKYTQKGYIEIELVDSEKKVQIKIKDTGIGMSKKTKMLIFEKFERSEEARKINVSGSGLGLYVAKVMTEAHNGRIFVESEGIGKGSTFTIEIPKEKL